MYEMLIAKKSKNINIKNDRAKKKSWTDHDLALNLLIAEYLMKKGLWYTASVMVSEAEFLEEPPEIEVVTSTKKQQNCDKLTEYKRQSPAKLTDQTVQNVVDQILDSRNRGMVDNNLRDYYIQGPIL